MYYSMREYRSIGYRKSNTKNKMYDAKLQNIKTGRIVHVPFGDKRYENFSDRTGLNLYPHLIHGDTNRKRLYKARHSGYIRKGYYSPGWFSMTQLWT